MGKAKNTNGLNVLLKSIVTAAIGGAAGAAAQSISTGQPITQAKGAAMAGAILSVAALFAPQPHK